MRQLTLHHPVELDRLRQARSDMPRQTAKE